MTVQELAQLVMQVEAQLVLDVIYHYSLTLVIILVNVLKELSMIVVYVLHAMKLVLNVVQQGTINVLLVVN